MARRIGTDMEEFEILFSYMVTGGGFIVQDGELCDGSEG